MTIVVLKVATLVLEGNYVFSLKGNQGKLRDAVTDYITERMANDFANIPARRYIETLKGHVQVD